MEVEMSLGELLINAIANGRIPGVQFKRGWSDERATSAGLAAVIESRLEGARRVAIQEALRQLRDEHPLFQLKTQHTKLLEFARLAADAPTECVAFAFLPIA